ncbi:MAG: heavy-metal-associated domain-containing protein [Chitinophagaceae bacterium]
MKKALFLMAFVAGIFSLANAQPKTSQTVTIKTPTVQCESCKQRIENTLAREEGVFKTVVNYKNKTTKVSFYTDRTNIENVKTAIANAGYDADDVTANPESYKKLPLCCKKVEDGGGEMKKH